MRKFFIDSKKIVALFLLVFLFSSCEDWLDTAPERYLIKDDFWIKTEDANSALAATYSAFREGALENFVWGEIRADILMGFPGTPGDGYPAIAGSDIKVRNNKVNWSKYYKTINLANTLMYYDKNILANDKSFTQEMCNAIDAEALFLRSLSYFYLVRMWKNVPLVTNASLSDTSNIYPYISTESEVIKQIIGDLLIAKDKAYTTKFMGNPKYFKGRANKYAIMALLADVYLWNQQYQECINYCDSVSNSGLFYLMEGANTDETKNLWFGIYNPGNSNESIFELQFKDDGTTNQTNPLLGGEINLFGGTPSFNSKYAVLFPDNIDIRVGNGRKTLWKFVGVTYNGDLKRSSSSERDLNLTYYRYADILLMKAEALNELGNVSEAMNYVNKTAQRAGLQPITGITDQAEMRVIILDERAKEFIVEGKRWFDLLRTAKRNNFQYKKQLGDLLVSLADARSQAVLKSKVNDTMMYYLPVPYDELQRNKNLKQNPFYER